MNTKQLRQKILDLAIRGKLVPQDPNDEPASVLLERVRTEKERLIKEGKIKRDKKESFIFQGDDKSHYQQLPQGWVWVLMDQIAKINMGQSPSGESVTKNMDGIEFHQGKIFFTDRYLAPSGQYTNERNKIADKNSVLLCIRAPVGIVNITDREIAIGRGLCSLFPFLDISTHFLYYWLIALQESFVEQATGTTFKAITTDVVRQQHIPIPPLAEQNRIVAAIESAFTVIDEIERNKTDLQSAVSAAKSKILSLAIRGKLVPQDPDDEPASALLDRIRAEREALIKAGKIKRDKGGSAIIRGDDNCYYGQLPVQWVQCHLESIGQIIGGGTPRTEETAYWEDGKIPWITPADLSGYSGKYIMAGSRMITEKGLSDSSAQLMPEGSILFSSRAPIGYIVIASNEVCTNQGFKSIVPFVKGVNEYIYYHLKAQVEEIRSRASGTTFKEISGKEMGNTIIMLPPLAEQHRIVVAIESFFEQLDSIKTILF